MGAAERHVEREKKVGRDPYASGGWDWEHYSQISICVSFCDRALCVFRSVCVCVLEEGREVSGEKREMKRMSVPLRKCHTGKICRF